MQLLQQPLLPQLSRRHGSSSSSSSTLDQRMYFWPINAATEAAMEQKWGQVLGSSRSRSSSSSSSSSYHAASTSNQTSSSSSSSSSMDDPAAAPTVVPVMFGRQLAVPRAAAGVASFHFLDLCGGPLGAADYMALAHNYHTVFITGMYI
jgi:predicted ATPase